MMEVTSFMKKILIPFPAEMRKPAKHAYLQFLCHVTNQTWRNSNMSHADVITPPLLFTETGPNTNARTTGAPAPTAATSTAATRPYGRRTA